MDLVREWFVIKTKPRREEQVEAVLARRGLEVYLPLIPSRRRREPEILFPGYLFSRLCLRSDQWLQARSAPGVSYFLGTDGKPSPVPESVVHSIRERAEARLEQGYDPGFSVGDRLLITSGVFEGLEAIFAGALTPAGRSRVLVEMLSRLVTVDLDVRVLERAPSRLGDRPMGFAYR